MKQAACAVLIFTMIILRIKPLSKDTRLLLDSVRVSGYRSYGAQ